MCANMALVALPGALAAQQPATSADAKWVQDTLHFHHAIECPVKCIEGKVRVMNQMCRAERMSCTLGQAHAMG